MLITTLNYKFWYCFRILEQEIKFLYRNLCSAHEEFKADPIGVKAEWVNTFERLEKLIEAIQNKDYFFPAKLTNGVSFVFFNLLEKGLLAIIIIIKHVYH